MSDGTAQRRRVWHASRDAYHCAFRFLRLLLRAEGSRLDVERLRILDMFLLFPPLLHRMSMTMPIRKNFRDLEIPDADQSFVRLPSIPAVFQDLRVYQNGATGHLLARGLLEAAPISEGRAQLTVGSVPKLLADKAAAKNHDEHALIEFLLRDLSSLPLAGSEGLYRRAGLPAKQLLL